MEDTLVSIIQSGLRYWVALLLMVPIGYTLSKKAYQSGDGWIKILGQDQFVKFGVAVLCLIIALPLVSYIGSEVQQFIYANLPSGKWLISLFGLGVIGVYYTLYDATDMSPNDEITRVVILGSLSLIVLPFLHQYIQKNYDLRKIWEETVIGSLIDLIIVPIQEIF